jgi:hypothetical protein
VKSTVQFVIDRKLEVIVALATSAIVDILLMVFRVLTETPPPKLLDPIQNSFQFALLAFVALIGVLTGRMVIVGCVASSLMLAYVLAFTLTSPAGVESWIGQMLFQTLPFLVTTLLSQLAIVQFRRRRISSVTT